MYRISKIYATKVLLLSLAIGLLAASIYNAMTAQMLVSSLQPVDGAAQSLDSAYIQLSFLERMVAPFTFPHFTEFWWRDFPFFSAVALAGLLGSSLLERTARQV